MGSDPALKHPMNKDWRPIKFQEIFATLYKNLGIDVSKARLIDPAGRPQYLVEMQPIAELA